MGKSLRVKVADEVMKEIGKTFEKDPMVAGAALSLFARIYCIEGLAEVSNEKDWPKVIDLLQARLEKWADKLPEEKFDLIYESICQSLSEEDIKKLRQKFGEEA